MNGELEQRIDIDPVEQPGEFSYRDRWADPYTERYGAQDEGDHTVEVFTLGALTLR
ncbi:hypothetical protein [Rhodococcus sp. WMMA185]|uniref:hypothetical protein n=1 Tax=Rhodococcus sp. WMMA185 TaxID=679318 RepID=UPI0012F47E4F|nr:hypothetical protein [Rhodococcus sp. WMMA185]